LTFKIVYQDIDSNSDLYIIKQYIFVTQVWKENIRIIYELTASTCMLL